MRESAKAWSRLSGVPWAGVEGRGQLEAGASGWGVYTGLWLTEMERHILEPRAAGTAD